MDISFHYFAVKTVARAAGYDERRAQRIAVFSQMIDDFNLYRYCFAKNIPDYLKAANLDIVLRENFNLINPVTTGFIDWVDMATLVLDRSQKYTVSPFHFIPQNINCIGDKKKRTVPATLNDNSYISDMLQELKADIKFGNIGDEDALMRMGMLFHTFADTYAHQLFSGYNSKVNSVKLIRVEDNETSEDVTGQYRFWVDEWISKIKSITGAELPTIGHMAIAHVPDLSHLTFTINYTGDDGRTLTYNRSNTSVFVVACKYLYDYMRDILGDYRLPDMDWEELSPKLSEGFLIDASRELDEGEAAAVEKLKGHWMSIFPGYEYDYDSVQIKKSFVTQEFDDVCTVNVDGEEMFIKGKNYSDDFYKFNYFADLHLIKLYGSKPRKWL